MIRQASNNDIPFIEDILLDAVTFLRKAGLENQWNEINIKWDSLSKDYKIDDFYIDYEDNIPVACMALTDYDKKYWPEIAKGKSIYLHKLAVKREFAGRGYSKDLINFAKDLSHEKGINSIRLDCNFYREKLRSVYENEGFVFVRKHGEGFNTKMALYLWH